ncbi:MAG: HAMP domain-containing protein [Gammaproteobacteria bacterium]|nr:HAMP domain-containing protein [Gammaproteobacteria bacterium]
MSLFLRIFLSFWFAAILLAVSFFLIGRYSGGEAIERTEAVLEAQAEVVASLRLEGGRRATMHWLFQQDQQQRPRLVDSDGQSPFPPQRHRDPQRPKLQPYGPVRPGIKRLKHGHVAVVVALPGVNPPLYLIKQIDPGQMHRLPMYLLPLIGIVIIGLVSLALAMALSRRIRHLRSAAQIIAEGDFSARVELTGRDEVSALAADFNLMAERISEMMVSQQQLVSDVSHELRSPLARLRIALELAERAEEPSPALARIAKEADELEQLVTDLLSLARIESGQSLLERQSVPLCKLLGNIVADASFEGEAHRRQVILEHCDEASVEGDPVLLHAAIENVVRNALRYTPEESTVVVRLQRDEQSLQITIDDQGPGVPEEALCRLFEPFARVAEARDRNSGGYGLGLAITGRTLTAHGGDARAENRPDGGLRVMLTLPLKLG